MCTLIRVDAIFTLTKVHSFGFLKQDANNYGVFCWCRYIWTPLLCTNAYKCVCFYWPIGIDDGCSWDHLIWTIESKLFAMFAFCLLTVNPNSLLIKFTIYWPYSLFVNLKKRKVRLQNHLWCFTLWIFYSVMILLDFTCHVDVLFYAWSHCLCSCLFIDQVPPKTFLLIYFTEAGDRDARRLLYECFGCTDAPFNSIS